MPYIKETVREGAFISDMKALLTKNGWTVGKTFYKVGIPVAQLGNPNGTFENTTQINFAIAQHQQLKNKFGGVYGFARVYTFSMQYVDLPTVFKNKTNVTIDEKVKEMHDFVFSRWPENEDETVLLDNSKFYVYMTEKETNTPTELDYLFASTGTAASVLDAELVKYKARVVTASGSSTLQIIHDESVLNDGSLVANDPLVMQSPITEIKTRITTASGWATNWWPDSLITVNGWVDSETVALVLQADAAAAPDDALVPTIPLYFGRIKSLDSSGVKDHVLFTGTTPNTATYSFDSTAKYLTTPMMPTLKSYPKYPANGIDDVIVAATKQGSRYQHHFIKAFNPPNKMPPDRKNGQKEFPSAWSGVGNDEYNQPVTSAYTDTVAISPAYISHAEERERGELDKIMLLKGVGVHSGIDLRVPLGTCPESYAYYKVFQIDAISPLTKRPSTQYRPMAIAIYEGSEPQ